MTTIRALTQADLPEAQRILRVAFGIFLGAPRPEHFWGDRDYVYGRFGAEHTAAFAAEKDESGLVGSNFATRWGSVGFFGPLTTRPDLWDGGFGQRLVAAACDQLDAWGIRHAGLFTFARQTCRTLRQVRFSPPLSDCDQGRPDRCAGHDQRRATRYSALPAEQRQEAENACRELTEELYPGLDLGGEIRTVAARARRHGFALGSRRSARGFCRLPLGTRE